MQWTDDGHIQVTRKGALAGAAVVLGLLLLAMFLIGMLVAGGGGDERDSGTELTAIPEDLNWDDEADEHGNGLSASKTEYSTCLARTWRAVSLDAKAGEFKPWEDRSTTRKVSELIELQQVDYITEHCRPLAPEPPQVPSSTCISKELQGFYRRHIPENSDTEVHKAIAAAYALTVCQPSASR